MGYRGQVLRTVDSGTTWASAVVERGADGKELRSVHMRGLDGWLSGADGTLMHSVDGGVSWNFPAASCPTLYDLFSVVQAPFGDYVWAVGDDGHVCKTSDAGASWTDETALQGRGLYSVREGRCAKSATTALRAKRCCVCSSEYFKQGISKQGLGLCTLCHAGVRFPTHIDRARC